MQLLIKQLRRVRRDARAAAPAGERLPILQALPGDLALGNPDHGGGALLPQRFDRSSLDWPAPTLGARNPAQSRSSVLNRHDPSCARAAAVADGAKTPTEDRTRSSSARTQDPCRFH